jgi:type IV pilus assembly protein PilE
MKNKGFTLVELMIVVAILSILVGIAAPMYRGYISSAKRSEATANLETIRLLQEQYYADNKVYLEGADTAALANTATGLPGFQPGNPADLYYEYSVAFTAADDQTFVATATPKANGAKNPNNLPDGTFTINETNIKNW